MIVKSPAGRMLLVAGVLVLALSACGRRGPPEAPPSAVEAAPAGPIAPAAPATVTPGVVPPNDPLFAAPVPGAAEQEDLQALPTTPDRPFILDGLL